MATNKVTFKKNISTFSLLMTGVTSIIGSGWLLGTQKIAENTGPAGVLSWIFGAGIVILVALFFLEIGTHYPSSGGIGFYSHITHGRFCGFITSWVNWLSIVAVPAIEAQGVVQYLSNLASLNLLYDPSTHFLTIYGLLCSAVLLGLFMLINFWSVQLFIKFNNFFTVLKIVIPLLTIGALVYNGLHVENLGFSPSHTFAPYGWSAIVGSVIGGGVIMSFNGFQSPLTFSEEIRSPQKQLSKAVIGSIVVALVIYLLLQITFEGSLTSKDLAQGWAHVNFRSPYIQLLMMANFHLMVLVVYFGAVISPAACGTTFLASSSRIMYSLANQNHLPAFIKRLHPKYQNPRNSIILCTLVGVCLIFLFQGWNDMVAVISILHVFSYVPAPIIALANRYDDKIKNQTSGDTNKPKQQFVLPFATFLAPLVLFILSTLLFFSEWIHDLEMFIFIIPGLFFFIYYDIKKAKKKDFKSNLIAASWLIVYLLCIVIINFLSDPTSQHDLLNTSYSLILLAILSVATTYYGVKVANFKGKEEFYTVRYHR